MAAGPRVAVVADVALARPRPRVSVLPAVALAGVGVCAWAVALILTNGHVSEPGVRAGGRSANPGPRGLTCGHSRHTPLHPPGVRHLVATSWRPRDPPSP